MTEHQSGPAFAILRPVHAPARTDRMVIFEKVTDPERELAAVFTERSSRSTPMALDIETRGNDPSRLDSVVVGVGLSDDRGSIYIDLRESHPDTWIWLLQRLERERVPLIAHNLFFDASYTLRDLRAAGHPTGWLNWQHCTYALYKLLASEGWPGQRWGLKDAQVALLGWPESNDKLLRRWLVENGHTTRPIGKQTQKKLGLLPEAPEPEPVGREQRDVPAWEEPRPDVQLVEGNEATVLELEGPLILTIRRKGD